MSILLSRRRIVSGVSGLVPLLITERLQRRWTATSAGHAVRSLQLRPPSQSQRLEIFDITDCLTKVALLEGRRHDCGGCLFFLCTLSPAENREDPDLPRAATEPGLWVFQFENDDLRGTKVTKATNPWEFEPDATTMARLARTVSTKSPTADNSPCMINTDLYSRREFDCALMMAKLLRCRTNRLITLLPPSFVSTEGYCHRYQTPWLEEARSQLRPYFDLVVHGTHDHWLDSGSGGNNEKVSLVGHGGARRLADLLAFHAAETDDAHEQLGLGMRQGWFHRGFVLPLMSGSQLSEAVFELLVGTFDRERPVRTAFQIQYAPASRSHLVDRLVEEIETTFPDTLRIHRIELLPHEMKPTIRFQWLNLAVAGSLELASG